NFSGCCFFCEAEDSSPTKFKEVGNRIEDEFLDASRVSRANRSPVMASTQKAKQIRFNLIGHILLRLSRLSRLAVRPRCRRCSWLCLAMLAKASLSAESGASPSVAAPEDLARWSSILAWVCPPSAAALGCRRGAGPDVVVVIDHQRRFGRPQQAAQVNQAELGALRSGAVSELLAQDSRYKCKALNWHSRPDYLKALPQRQAACWLQFSLQKRSCNRPEWRPRAIRHRCGHSLAIESARCPSNSRPAPQSCPVQARPANCQAQELEAVGRGCQVALRQSLALPQIATSEPASVRRRRQLLMQRPRRSEWQSKNARAMLEPRQVPGACPGRGAPGAGPRRADRRADGHPAQAGCSASADAPEKQTGSDGWPKPSRAGDKDEREQVGSAPDDLASAGVEQGLPGFG
uniref:Secreted protein n=1 Tax=Macrostomum lignano TaxID=282301 RepID=A0A1I8FPQ9_9PLAT